MFDSKISVKDLIEELQNEVDIALDIPNATYVQWLNALQQILYTEVIKEQRRAYVYEPSTSLISINENLAEDENKVRFEDIHTVYATDNEDVEIQLKKTTPTSGYIFSNTFFKENEDFRINTDFECRMATIIYYVKPALIDKETLEGNVMIPIEFIDLVKAKLRGEAYKLANEDNLAAKWLNDYNVLLETFKAWIADKSANFGL